MPRIPRREQLGEGESLVHVISRGNRRQDVYLAERDYRLYLALLAEALQRHGVRCHAYVLMPNHVHALLEGTQEAISAAMQRANGRYARWFNHAYGLVGHVFQGRFWSEPLESEAHLLELARYIVNNPVRAGIAEDAAGWPWSSMRATLARVPRPRFLTTRFVLAHFGARDGAGDRAAAAFADFVAAGAWKPPPRRAPPQLPAGVG